MKNIYLHTHGTHTTQHTHAHTHAHTHTHTHTRAHTDTQTSMTGEVWTPMTAEQQTTTREENQEMNIETWSFNHDDFS